MGYHTPGRDGSLLTLEGAIRSIDDAERLKRYRAQASPQIGLPTHHSVHVDPGLLKRLLAAWRRVYVSGRDRKVFRRLFRSLEVAFHAAQHPGDGLPSLSDVGNRLALWVSAFEVLFHPGGGRKVNKRTVQNALGRVKWDKKELTHRRYLISHHQQQSRVTLPEKFYDDLYRARNQFLHGNPVTSAVLRYRQSLRYVQLQFIAPVLYNAALLSFLDGKVRGGPSADPDDIQDFLEWHDGLWGVQDALFAASHQIDQFGHPQVPSV